MNIPFLISGIAFAVLFVSYLSKLSFTAIVILFAVALLRQKNVFPFWRSNLSIPSLVLSVGILTLSAFPFYEFVMNKIHINRLDMLAELTGITKETLMFIITFLICVAAFYFISIVAEFVLLYLPNPDSLSSGNFSNGHTPTKLTHVLFVFLTAIVTISICSKSSPLYPLNDWVDPNIYFTIGKSILHGKLPYRDLFDHKGPLMYLIHTLGALVSETSFLGVYFIEVVACTCFLWFSLQTIRLYRNSASLLMVPVLAAIVYSSAAFSYGDSAEELCLPFLAYAIYVGLKAVRAGEVPSYRECMLIGITSSCIFWTKYSLLGLYVGWICVPAFLLLKSGKIQKLFRMLLTILGGYCSRPYPFLPGLRQIMR